MIQRQPHRWKIFSPQGVKKIFFAVLDIPWLSHYNPALATGNVPFNYRLRPGPSPNDASMAQTRDVKYDGEQRYKP